VSARGPPCYRYEETIDPRFQRLDVGVKIRVLRALISDEVKATSVKECLFNSRKIVLPIFRGDRPRLISLDDKSMRIDDIPFLRMDDIRKMIIDLDCACYGPTTYWRIILSFRKYWIRLPKRSESASRDPAIAVPCFAQKSRLQE
jgi:hypothetical protein